jgi:carboxypeptidase PM20D1
VVNFRLLPGDSTTDVLARVRRLVDDEGVTATALDRTRSEPAAVSSVEGEGFQVLANAAQRAFPDALVIPTMVTGATDSRHFAGLADAVYRFVPRRTRPDDLARFHGTDERVEVDGFAREIETYREIVVAGASGGGAAERRATR